MNLVLEAGRLDRLLDPATATSGAEAGRGLPHLLAVAFWFAII
jgi:hypothetical protein